MTVDERADGLECMVHPQFQVELKALADGGFRYEDSIGRVLAIIDERFVSPEEADPLESWASLPSAQAGRADEFDLRCIDPDDGRITLIATLRGRTLYLISAARATVTERAAAVRVAIERVSDRTWCPAK
jgi:hypothetical protein